MRNMHYCSNRTSFLLQFHQNQMQTIDSMPAIDLILAFDSVLSIAIVADVQASYLTPIMSYVTPVWLMSLSRADFPVQNLSRLLDHSNQVL